MPNGTLKIIDRRKDLVKLQLGEYVSLGKVLNCPKPIFRRSSSEISTFLRQIESCVRLLPEVESVCSCADPTRLSTVALVVPNEEALRKLDNEVSNNNNNSNGAISSSGGE